MFDVQLRDCTGWSYSITGAPEVNPVLAPLGELTGLVGSVSRSDLALPARPGVVLGERRFGAIQAEVNFYLHEVGGVDLDEIYYKFRRGWSTRTPSMFSVYAGKSGGRWHLPVYLEKPLPGVEVNPTRRSQINLPVSVVAPSGLFESDLHSVDVEVDDKPVTVHNPGEVVTYPVIRYTGEGGRVTSPSGASFDIPQVSNEVAVDLDPRNLRVPGVLPEGVPAGQSATWHLPAGSRVEWRVRVSDPWA